MRHAFYFNGMPWNSLNACLAFEATCGSQLMEKSLFYPSQRSVASIQGPRRDGRPRWVEVKSEPSTRKQLHTTLGRGDCCDVHQIPDSLSGSPPYPTRSSIHLGPLNRYPAPLERINTDLSIGWPPQVIANVKHAFKLPLRHSVQVECVAHSQKTMIMTSFIP